MKLYDPENKTKERHMNLRQKLRNNRTVCRAVGQVLSKELQFWGSPRSINGGGCYDFARAVSKELNGEDWRILSVPGHSWIEVDGLHYDAEAPSGVPDWKELPFWRRTPPRADEEPTVSNTSDSEATP